MFEAKKDRTILASNLRPQTSVLQKTSEPLNDYII
jgi:hypothetical protein